VICLSIKVNERQEQDIQIPLDERFSDEEMKEIFPFLSDFTSSDEKQCLIFRRKN
jgi:hypothetical protein